MVSIIMQIILHAFLLIKITHCIDPPCSVESSGQGGGFAFCSPKYIIKKDNIYKENFNKYINHLHTVLHSATQSTNKKNAEVQSD
jgi:hypothetical protein